MFVSIVCLFFHDIEWMTCKKKDIPLLMKANFSDEKRFFFAVDYPLNYEYRKVIHWVANLVKYD